MVNQYSIFRDQVKIKIKLIKLRTIKLDNDDLTKVKYTTLGLFLENQD